MGIGDWKKPITYYLLPITHYPLPITYYPLPITYYLLPITQFKMTIIQGLTKAILYVRNIDTQTKFYCDQLGLTIKSQKSIEGRSDKQWVEFETGECTLVLHGNLEPQHGKDRPKLAFHVNDFDAAYQTLIERGVKLSQIRSPSPGLKIAEGADPEGNPFTIDCQEY